MLAALEPVAWKCLVKLVFLKILWNSQEKTGAGVSYLIKLQAGDLEIYKKETQAFWNISLTS